MTNELNNMIFYSFAFFIRIHIYIILDFSDSDLTFASTIFKYKVINNQVLDDDNTCVVFITILLIHVSYSKYVKR